MNQIEATNLAYVEFGPTVLNNKPRYRDEERSK